MSSTHDTAIDEALRTRLQMIEDRLRAACRRAGRSRAEYASSRHKTVTLETPHGCRARSTWAKIGHRVVAGSFILPVDVGVNGT